MSSPYYGRPVDQPNPLASNLRVYFGWFATDDGVLPMFKYDVISAFDHSRSLRIVDVGPEEKNALKARLAAAQQAEPNQPVTLLDIAAQMWPKART